MPKEYTREQLRQLYIKLPQEIKEVASADETTESIENVCEKNGITDERVGEISDLIRNVLFGVLPPDDFQTSLQKEIKLEKEAAKKVAQEINRFIFYPLKPALEELYKIEVGAGKGKPEEKESSFAEATEDKEKPTAPREEDEYREPIE